MLVRILKIILIIIVAAIVIAGGVLVWRAKRMPAEVKILPPAPVETPTATSTPENTVEARLPAEWQKVYDVDKDFDGLSDADEEKYKTSTSTPDTDSDGLLDRDEVRLYQTDPLKADTDGDGFSDGYEVRRGYDPKGRGRLKND